MDLSEDTQAFEKAVESTRSRTSPRPPCLRRLEASFQACSLASRGNEQRVLKDGRSEAHLSLMVRFLFNPLIALAVGALVGLLSSDHPALTSVIGLTPWALM